MRIEELEGGSERFLEHFAFDIDRINLVERQMDDKADKHEKTGQPRLRGRLS